MSHQCFDCLLTIKPARTLKKWVIVIHTLALAAGMANALPVVIKISLFAVICLHLRYALGRLNAQKYTIKYTDALGWEISEGHDFYPITILRSTVITTYVLFLHFKPGFRIGYPKSGIKKTLLILKDSMAEDDYRYLIVKLKMAGIK
ncbi:MAG: hypothetical protein PHG00_06415 [Methylococcales bacterium]|nr:hypothetical protein [Methylococcales bacterium]